MILQETTIPEAVARIERVGLTHTFDLLRSLHVFCGDRMGFTAIRSESTDSPLHRWHEALAAYLAAVIYTQHGNPELKARLTAPCETMAKAVTEAAKRRMRPEPEPVP